MNAPLKGLKDEIVRRQAILDLEHSYLVEAGADPGKTSVMAGRVIALLASGVPPKAIVAVTFTELAASELLERIERYAATMARGEIPKDLACAYDAPLDGDALTRIQTALPQLDDMVCTTIHGFCQRLISPYPAEADIDPGATLIDRSGADALFDETFDRWLHERLQDGGSDLLAEMVAVDATRAKNTIRMVADTLRREPGAVCDPAVPYDAFFGDFLAKGLRLQRRLRPGCDRGSCDRQRRRPVPFDGAGCLERAVRSGTLPHGPAGIDRLPSRASDNGWGSSKAADQDRLQGPGFAIRPDGRQGGRSLLGPLLQARGACETPLLEGRSHAALSLLGLLVPEARDFIARYQTIKRERARLDFDDLINAARALLRKHDTVRRHLGERFRHILVDEFQDTDPAQSEIFWLLAGNPPKGEELDVPWDAYVPRPGSLFLVGDPKQGIYRFRGADIASYTRAKTALETQHDGAVLQISSNFRSCKTVLEFINKTFEGPLGADPKLGFHPLDPTVDDHPSGLCVAGPILKLTGPASANDLRDREAAEVAKLCAALIGSFEVRDRDGTWRPCRPSDIGLLSPASTQLWRYEQQLEDMGIPVATQAGKGFFWRQEVQDLIAFARAISDRRDTIALAAFLRGPMVGLTERELLEAAQATEKKKLRLDVDYSALADGPGKRALEQLDWLSKQARKMTPYEILELGVDMFNMRAQLLNRHGAQAERGLTNLDTFLEQSRAWSGRGLKAFANAMTEAWEEEERQAEGRPDAQEEAVSLFTMHSAQAWNGRSL